MFGDTERDLQELQASMEQLLKEDSQEGDCGAEEAVDGLLPSKMEDEDEEEEENNEAAQEAEAEDEENQPSSGSIINEEWQSGKFHRCHLVHSGIVQNYSWCCSNACVTTPTCTAGACTQESGYTVSFAINVYGLFCKCNHSKEKHFFKKSHFTFETKFGKNTLNVCISIPVYPPSENKISLLL